MQSQGCVRIVSVQTRCYDVLVIEINVSGWKGDQSINVKSIVNVTAIFSHLQSSMGGIEEFALCKWGCRGRIRCARQRR